MAVVRLLLVGDQNYVLRKKNCGESEKSCRSKDRVTHPHTCPHPLGVVIEKINKREREREEGEEQLRK